MKNLLLSFGTACLLSSCNGQQKSLPNENNEVFRIFSEWKIKVLKDSSYVRGCPSFEDFETISDTAKYSKLEKAHNLPDDYSVSFGDFNNDKKQDALFSFEDFLCAANALGASPGWTHNRSSGFVLVVSNNRGYQIANEKLDLQKIENAISKELKSIRVSICFNKIYTNNSLSGICKVWSNEKNGGLGMCCPDKLFLITIDIKEKKIGLHISEYEYEIEHEINY